MQKVHGHGSILLFLASETSFTDHQHLFYFIYSMWNYTHAPVGCYKKKSNNKCNQMNLFDLQQALLLSELLL